MPLSTTPTSPGISLFAYLRAHIGKRFEVFDCTKATLVHVSHTVEDLILREQLPAVLLTGFQESSHWRAETERYRALAAVAQQVCIFAGGTPGPDAHEREIRVTLMGDDPLRQEWFVCALTPQLAFVLCGQDRDVVALEEASRQFSTFWTFEPAIVAEVLDLLEGVVAHYRPERLAELRRAREQLPLAQPDARLLSALLREMVRFEDQLQRVIRERELRYKIVSELTTDCLYTIYVGREQQLRYEWLGDALSRLAGYDAGSAPAQEGLAALAHPDDQPLVQARLANLLAGHEDIAEFRVVVRGGDLRWVRNYARPIIDQRSDRVKLIIGAVSDITERRRAEQVLQQSHLALEERVQERTAELRSALQRAQALYAITNDAIASGNLVEALQRAIERAVATINADRVIILFFDWEARRTELFLSAGPGRAHVITTTDFDEFMAGLTGWAVRERRAAISPKNLLDPRESPAVQRRRAETNCGAVLVLPLIYLDEVFGTLTAINRPDEPNFTAEDIDLLSAIAGQIALAYARIRLTAHLQRANAALRHEVSERTALSQQLQQQAEHATAMAALSRALAEAGRELQPLFDTIAEHMTRLSGDACVLTLLSRDGQTMRLVASGHRHPESAALMRQLLPSAYPAHLGLTAQVVQDGQPLRIPLVLPEASAVLIPPEMWPYLERLGIASLMIVPLRVHGRILGTLGVWHNQPDKPYNEADQVFLQDLADRAGLAIENAQLFITAAQARAEAEQANRAKDEFLANMSHELRTPLNAILAYSESLQDAIYGPLAPRQRGAIDAVQSAGRHLLTLINDILDLAKIEAGRVELQTERVQVVEMCQASLVFVREQALRKRQRLSLRMSHHEATIDVDPGRLKQMLVNLLSNAVKFTPDEGKVGLEVTLDSDAGVALFTVHDTGIGIAPEDLGRLFQPFSQVDASLSREYEGTGLGLALVRRLAELHGGKVSVESAVGMGSRFTITLPYHNAPAAALAEQEPAALPAGASLAPAVLRGCILLVEDNETNISTLNDYLQARGYEVVVARDGYEALTQADELRPQLILMDIHMPHMDGLEAIRRLRDLPAHAATPIIALTALAMPGDEECCLAAGATAYMTKPVSLRGLVAKIQQLLER